MYSSAVPKFSEPDKKNPMVDELRTHKPFPPPNKKTLGAMYNSIEPEFPQPVPEKKKKISDELRGNRPVKVAAKKKEISAMYSSDISTKISEIPIEESEVKMPSKKKKEKEQSCLYWVKRGEEGKRGRGEKGKRGRGEEGKRGRGEEGKRGSREVKKKAS
jgi:hypothetical protein